MICSTAKANRSSTAPVETMRDDELSLMIIEKEVKIKKRGKRTKGNENVVLVVQLLLCRVAIT